MTSVLSELLVARRPVLDADVEVVGYELLHRGVDDAAGQRATTGLIVDSLLTLGRAELTGGADVWVHVPTDLLRSDALLGLPPDGTVLGVPRGARVDDELRRAIVRHRAVGFRLALDDLAPGDPRLDLLPLVEHPKVDLTADGGFDLVAQLAAVGHRVVAGPVGSYDELERVLARGAELVQGLFWTTPRDVRAVRPRSFAPGHLALLEALAEHEVDFDEVEHLIRTDLTLSDRFLRLVRATLGYRPIESIHDGLVLLGVRAVQRWVALLVLGRVDETAPAELVTLASTRARGCELLEEMRGGHDRLDAFTLGMFSVLGPGGRLDAATLDGLPVSPAVREALEHGTGHLRPLLDVELATEQADWGVAVDGGRALGLAPDQVARAGVEAMSYSSLSRA